MKDDVDYIPGPVNDDDDVDLGKGPIAIEEPDNIQELYLISHDKSKRLLIRRKKYNNGNNGRYGLEMLQLRSFDAGKKHDFSNTSATENPGIYDGAIDTWACDYSKGYVCKGESVGGAYANYRLPEDEDDGWVELSAGDVSIEDWDLEIYPLKDPSLARREPLYQQNPYVRVSFTMKLDKDSWQTKISDEQRERYVLPLQTMFSFTPHS